MQNDRSNGRGADDKSQLRFPFPGLKPRFDPLSLRYTRSRREPNYQDDLALPEREEK